MNLQTINASASPEVQMNENFETLEHQAVYGKRHPVTTGLTWGYCGGRWGGFSITEGTVTLTDDDDNHLVVAIATGVLSASTATTNWNDDANYLRIYKITTASGAVTAIEDHRGGPGGVHGGGGSAGSYQPLDSDLTTIAGLTATSDNFLQAKSSAWASRTVAQVSADLQATGLVTDAVGFRTIPQNSKSADYTTVAADSGKHLLHPAADTSPRTFTIDSNANVPYPVGTAITFVTEHGAGVLTIAITSDTMRLAGAGTTGSRTLAADGVATALKITSTSWIISGTGLT